MKAKIFALILLACSIIFGQNNFPKIALNDLPGSIISKEQTFDGESLWGYIDGGADLYLEYGFTSLFVQDLDYNKIHFTINIYKMNDSASAFGIYSISKYKCSKVDSVSDFNCMSNYQFQIAKGRFYIQIINDKGNENSKAMSVKLASIVLRKIDETDFTLPELFHNNLFTNELDNLKFMNGILGIQNGYTDWADRFQEGDNFSLYLLPIEKENNSLLLSIIKFSNEEQLKEFLSPFKTEFSFKDKFKMLSIDKKTIAIASKNNIIYYLEGDNSFADLNLYIEALKECGK